MIAAHPDMKPWVVHNKTVPLELLRKLAHDPDADVGCSVAMKRELDAELFELLAADPDPQVRRRGASVMAGLLLLDLDNTVADSEGAFLAWAQTKVEEWAPNDPGAIAYLIEHDD